MPFYKVSAICNEMLWHFKKLHRHCSLAEEKASSLEFYQAEIKKNLPTFDSLSKGVMVDLPTASEEKELKL